MKKIKIYILSFLSALTIFCFIAIPSVTTHAAEEAPGTEAISNVNTSEAVSNLSIATSEPSALQESQSAVIEDSSSSNVSDPVVENPNESEDDIDKAALEKVIESLKAQLEKYKGIVENDTLKAIISALVTFLTAFGALWLKFRSFDKANLSLGDSQELLKIAQAEVTTLTKDIANLTQKVRDSESTNNGLIDLFGKSIDTINTAMIRFADKLEELEEQVKSTNKEGK